MKLNFDEIKDFYESQDGIWPKNDKWHAHTKINIESYIQKHKNLFKNKYILNAGSGGNTYGLDFDMNHLDIIDKYILKFPNHTISKVEDMPFLSANFDAAICVGSVINYCDAIGCISELNRVLKSKSYLILEFESSWSMELFNTTAFKQPASIVKTKYFDEEHSLWFYSFKYISNILKEYDFELIEFKRFHIISSFIYKVTKNENLSALFTNIDRFLKFIPFFSNHSHNIILLCQKK